MLSSIVESSTLITEIKDIFNILFFLLTGILAIMTYFNARKTLFSPIRTEVFKLQIKEFEEIISKFRDIDENKILEMFDEEKILYINFCCIMIAYAKRAFNMQIKYENYNPKDAIGFIISASKFEKCMEKVELVSSPPESKGIEEKEEDIGCEVLSYTKKYEENTEEIKNLSKSPVLPSIISNKILVIYNKESDNIKIMRETLDDFCKKLPLIASNVEDFRKISLSGLYNIYNSKRIEIKPFFEDVNSEINKYLKIEGLIK